MESGARLRKAWKDPDCDIRSERCKLAVAERLPEKNIRRRCCHRRRYHQVSLLTRDACLLSGGAAECRRCRRPWSPSAWSRPPPDARGWDLPRMHLIKHNTGTRAQEIPLLTCPMAQQCNMWVGTRATQVELPAPNGFSAGQFPTVPSDSWARTSQSLP